MRTGAFGEQGLTVLDRLGNWLSLREIRRYLPSQDAPYLLDLGAGYQARLLRALFAGQGTAHAVDLRLDPSLRSHPGFVTTETPIATALEGMATNTADLILLISVLEHLPDPGKILAECHRVLKPGGRLLINVPTWRGRWFLETAAFRLLLCPAEEIDDHKQYYEISTLWPLLVGAGFRPSHIKLAGAKFGLTLFGAVQKQPLPSSC